MAAKTKKKGLKTEVRQNNAAKIPLESALSRKATASSSKGDKGVDKMAKNKMGLKEKTNKDKVKKTAAPNKAPDKAGTQVAVAQKSKKDQKSAAKTKSAMKAAHKLSKAGLEPSGSPQDAAGPQELPEHLSPKQSITASPQSKAKLDPKAVKANKKAAKIKKRAAYKQAIADACRNANVSDAEKQKLKLEAIALIKAGLPSTLRPFVPDKWAVKFKPALGSYRKFVTSLPDIFVVDGDNDKYELRLNEAKVSPQVHPKTSPNLKSSSSPKAASKASPKAGVVKTIVKKKKGQSS